MGRLSQYLGHWRRSTSKHGVHSPFVYALATQVLPHVPTDEGARIEALRAQCARSREVREIDDLGAGYGGQQRPRIRKTMAEVVRSSARTRREGEFLMRLCRHCEPGQVLELGTNLGFSALYLAAGMPRPADLLTVEGAPALAGAAARNFEQMGVAPRQIVGDFAKVMADEIDWQAFRPGMVLLDGNHRKAPTLAYFESLLDRVAPGAVIVLDDIYWSDEMQAAWREIAAHPRVGVSIDLFCMGLCFLDRPQAKEHFSLRFPSW